MCKNKRQETHPTIHDPAKAHKSPHLYNFILTGEQVYSISAWQKHGQKTPPLFFHFTLRFLCTCNSMPRQHVFKTQSSQPHNRTTRHLHAQSTLCLAGKKRRQLFQTVYLCMTFKDLPAPGETNAKDLAHLLPALILQYATAKTLVYNCIHVCLLSTTFTSKFT